MMFSELVTASTAQEGMMRVGEGQSVNFVENSQEVELAFTDRSNSGYDDVVVVPQRLLTSGGTISSPDLPFDRSPGVTQMGPLYEPSVNLLPLSNFCPSGRPRFAVE